VGSDREWHRDREFARESAVRVLRLYLHECVLKSGLGLGEELNAEWISGGIWADGDNQNENIASVNNQDVQQDAQDTMDAEDKGHASTCNMQQ